MYTGVNFNEFALYSQNKPSSRTKKKMERKEKKRKGSLPLKGEIKNDEKKKLPNKQVDDLMYSHVHLYPCGKVSFVSFVYWGTFLAVTYEANVADNLARLGR